MTTPNHMYEDKIDIYREARTVDSGGSPISTFAINLSNVATMVQPFDSAEAVKGGREFSKPMITCFVDDALDILMSDQVVYNGNKYDIVENNIWPNVYMELIAEKIE